MRESRQRLFMMPLVFDPIATAPPSPPPPVYRPTLPFPPSSRRNVAHFVEAEGRRGGFPHDENGAIFFLRRFCPLFLGHASFHQDSLEKTPCLVLLNFTTHTRKFVSPILFDLPSSLP